MKGLLTTAIRSYQKLLSPLKSSRCPFTPTCSEYTIDSLQEYGSVKGSVLGIWRILRCNPFNKGYYDPPKNWAVKLKMDKEQIERADG